MTLHKHDVQGSTQTGSVEPGKHPQTSSPPSAFEEASRTLSEGDLRGGEAMTVASPPTKTRKTAKAMVSVMILTGPSGRSPR